MTAPVDVCNDLVAWAAQAGFQVTQGSQSGMAGGGPGSDRTILWTKQGEVRYFIGVHPSGWFSVSMSDRMGAEELVFAAESMSAIELYFYGKCGLSMRSKQRLPLLVYPQTVDEMAPGYTLGSKHFDDAQRLALVNSDGAAIAVSASGKIMGTAELTLLSKYLTTHLSDIKASYLDPSGQPLFRLRQA